MRSPLSPRSNDSCSPGECVAGVGLGEPLSTLKGVGPARERIFERLGIETLGDLVFRLPRRLESSGSVSTLAQAIAHPGGEVLVFDGEVRRHRFSRFGRKATLRLTIAEGNRELEVIYFNQPWQRDRFVQGRTYTFAGRVSRGPKGPLVIAPKSAEGKAALPAETWVPLYGVAAGLGQGQLRSLLALALKELEGAIPEPLSRSTLERLDLPCLAQAVQNLHFPANREAFARARRRVLLREFMELQSRMLGRVGSQCTRLRAHVIPRSATGETERRLHLPFELTAGQREILQQLQGELAQGVPMRRLLQGDVGAGKTILALLLAADVTRAGGQCAFMAPTELLAEQHFDGSRQALEVAGVRGALLTGSMSGPAHRAVLRRLKRGEIDVLFGTHALFSKDVAYKHLVLCVIDEQQRFGVAQRARLLEKGGSAHLLLMTATPIPRTLALTVYGDLELSVLREKPPGRGGLRTRWLRPKDGERLPGFLRERLRKGEQIFWVCPRIGEGEETGAEATFKRLSASELAEFGIALVHGKLPTEQRSERLDAFRKGAVKLLVATTVIEVGVDVPAATVMVIEEAERFGLAQLHQLRGRVGRGEKSSWCLLYGKAGGGGKASAADRFELLEGCSDGFEIAEHDLRQRGMGELTGLRQSGDLGGMGDCLEDDLDLLLEARGLVFGGVGEKGGLGLSVNAPSNSQRPPVAPTQPTTSRLLCNARHCLPHNSSDSP